MAKVEHIGIAVQNMEDAIKTYTLLLGVSPYKEELVESEGVRTVFFQLENIKIELLEALSTQSPVGKFLEKRGEGLHHIALEPNRDIADQHQYLQSNTIKLLNEKPKEGADEKNIFFVHPKDAHGVLLEFCKEQ
ncbi:MAG: methylmalonyl-CoA epimerase [Cytophagaceae bacterium]|jgi:methylmalonyl-CoA/ethylmalonyl-CoA epimerase|nr:methylmalonyl-CoA epimerase [Cytophagaceae bacterium]